MYKITRWDFKIPSGYYLVQSLKKQTSENPFYPLNPWALRSPNIFVKLQYKSFALFAKKLCALFVKKTYENTTVLLL
ncbi:hypothetical protein APR43_19340 [Flavobacterium sp. NLM]|nr:hypothetical protein AKO67_22055 [Flavobacterium sp. VMW]OWU89349.1 hypothetical protein APR43_19340 [Flavobacterium sp. NLM]